MRLFLVALLTMLPAAVRADEPKQEALSAKQILKRVDKVYRNCKSYRDNGVVKSVITAATGNATEEKPFSTAFIRPDRFRFEYKDLGNPTNGAIVSVSGKKVQTWFAFTPGVNDQLTLGLALGTAAGVSSLSSNTIPALLLPNEVEGARLTDMTKAKLLEDDDLGDSVCHCIKGKYSDMPCTVWIDKTSFLILRVDMVLQSKDVRAEMTTTYMPEIDVEIADAELEFDPPKE